MADRETSAYLHERLNAVTIRAICYNVLMFAGLILTVLAFRQGTQTELFQPKVAEGGVVELPIADEANPSKFSSIWSFEGSGWNSNPSTLQGTPASGLVGVASAIVGSEGTGTATAKPFRVTDAMKSLDFGLAGNGDIGTTYAALSVVS